MRTAAVANSPRPPAVVDPPDVARPDCAGRGRLRRDRSRRPALPWASERRSRHFQSRAARGGVSPYLVEGHRNGKGHGHGFVGTLDNSWASLAREDRQTAAEMLVLRLREHGLEQVMIYDRDRALRIQAIGTQPVRAL